MTNSLFTSTERPETLSASVLTQIKNLLLNGCLMPGESLPLRATAEALGVSVMPVREAVHQLVAEQALEVSPNRAVRVPVLSQAQFDEITKIRMKIEGYAVEEACLHITSNQIQRIKNINQQLAEQIEGGRIEGGGLVALNKQFHFCIYEASQMPMLVRMIESLWLRIGPILNCDLRNGSEQIFSLTAIKHHQQLIEALMAQDKKAARQALFFDIETAYQHVIKKQYSSSYG